MSYSHNNSAKSLSLSLCGNCHQIVHLNGVDTVQLCPCCLRTIHYRHPDSIHRTLAFTLTAMLALIPANLYPIMTVVSLGQSQSDTIISGVIKLIEMGMLPIALVVFIASVLIPILKIISLLLLLLCVHYPQLIPARQSTRLYRIVEFVGRWSMLDLFVISILSTLINLGGIATIEASIGAGAFGVSILFTIFAALSFDPRLLWDSHESRNS
jgi:paraquat-inducible protein A